jgi:hypothetical protein
MSIFWINNIYDVYMIIVKVVEDMAKYNVDVESFKQQLKKDDIQLVLRGHKFFIKFIVSNLFFKINGKSNSKFSIFTKVLF